MNKKIALSLVSVLLISGIFVSAKTTLAYSIPDGHVWAFNFTVPDGATTLNMDFDNWVNNLSGVLPGSNIQFHSTESLNAPDGDTVATINNSTRYRGTLALKPGSDSDESQAGRQIHVIVTAFQFVSADGATTNTSAIWNCSSASGGSNSYNCDTSSEHFISTPILTTINITPITSSITTGVTTQLTITFMDQDGVAFNGATTTFASSDSTIATVDNTGLVTGVATGTATITATSVSGTNTVTGTATIIVTTTTPPETTTVSPQPMVKNINTVVSSPDINVDYGTLYTDTGLPTTIQVTLDDNSTQDLPIVWSQGSYDGNTAGTYIVTGMITLPSDESITNTNNLIASVNIIVLPQLDSSSEHVPFQPTTGNGDDIDLPSITSTTTPSDE
jgi:uncharacterized protein YjdB